jgi:hypothetical protein
MAQTSSASFELIAVGRWFFWAVTQAAAQKLPRQAYSETVIVGGSSGEGGR